MILLIGMGFGLPLRAQENLLYNAGFERSKPVNIRSDGADIWAELLKRGVEIQTGDSVRMPAWWAPNPSDGWAKGFAASFRYVTGQPGREVHTGEHALFLSSKGSAASVAGGGGFRVVEDFENAGKQRALPLKKPFAFSFHAKGSGTVAVRLYTYPFGKENYGLYRVTPPQFTITDQWQQYHGTLEFTRIEEFTEPGRVADSGATFVMTVINGAVTLDDVALDNPPLDEPAPASSGKPSSEDPPAK